MAVSLTCSCGARLEIDDKFAGQTVFCPDCQRALEAPKTAAGAVALRTSGFALASIILALVGAFTILGTMAAVALGIVALLQIARQPDRLAGKKYALAGIVLGVMMTAGTVLALSRVELLGLTTILNDTQWAGKLDMSGPLEVVPKNGAFSIKRPSDRWGVYKPPSVTGDFQSMVFDELLLVQPADDIVVLCFAQSIAMDSSIYSCLDLALKKLESNHYDGLFTKATKNQRGTISQEGSVRVLPKGADNVSAAERVAVKKVANEEKKLLVRVYKKEHDTIMYIVVGATPKGNFERVQPAMREAMDSFKILNRPGE